MTTESSQDLEANIRKELAEMSGDNAYSGTNENSEVEPEAEETTEDVETEEISQDSDESTQDTEEASPEKKASNVPKILKQRNIAREEAAFWKAKAEELSTQKGYEESDVEYISALASKIASERIADDKFYGTNPSAVEFKDKVEEYKKAHNLDTETAYKLFLINEQPDEFAVQNRKADVKKSNPPAVGNSKLRSEPKPADMTTSQLEAELRKMLSKGELEI